METAGTFTMTSRFSSEARALVASVAVYSLAQALFGVFVAAFILRSSGNDISNVIVFQLAQFASLPPAAYLNAFVRHHFRAVTLYASAIVFQAAAFLVLTAGFAVDRSFVIMAGVLFGVGAGFLWPNRHTLVLDSLPDALRNRYYGIEECFVVTSGVLVPVAAGAFIVSGLAVPATAYRLLAAIAFGLVALSAALLFRAHGWCFDPPRMSFRFWVTPAWRWFAPFAALKGSLHFYAYILPALFVSGILGRDEGVLGIVQGAVALVAAIAVFLLGRWTGPASRVKVYTMASLLYATAAIVQTMCQTPLMAVVFLGCLALAQPTAEFSSCALAMRVIDRCEADQPGSTCFFLCAFEAVVFLGRFVAAGAYFAAAAFLSSATALVVVLAAVGFVQVLSVFFAHVVAARS